MQPIKQLSRVLACLAGRDQALFSLADLRAALPEHASGAFRAIVMRAEREGLLTRVCRGLYLYPGADGGDGLILYRAAARLRAGAFNYISLESALSDAGVISQIPMTSRHAHVVWTHRHDRMRPVWLDRIRAYQEAAERFGRASSPRWNSSQPRSRITGRTQPELLARLAERTQQLRDDAEVHKGFAQEIARFLPRR